MPRNTKHSGYTNPTSIPVVNHVTPKDLPTGSFDVFISYRRKGSKYLAYLIYERLRHDGYNVYFDKHLHAGKFPKQLYEKINSCTDFILVLPPGGMDTCSDEKDWLRREAEQALRCDKNIIPIMMENFEFPDKLPDSLRELPNYQSISEGKRDFDDWITDLEENYLSCDKKLMSSSLSQPQKPLLTIIASVLAVMFLSTIMLFFLKTHQSRIDLIDNREITVIVNGIHVLDTVNTFGYPAGAEISIIATPSECVQTLYVSLDGGSFVEYTDQSFMSYTESETPIPSRRLSVKALYDDGTYHDGLNAQDTQPLEYHYYTSEPTPKNKGLCVMVDGEVVTPEKEYTLKAGTNINIFAYPPEMVEKLILDVPGTGYHNEKEESYYQITYKDGGSMPPLYINVLYRNGQYLDGKWTEEDTNGVKYMFNVTHQFTENKNVILSVDGKELVPGEEYTISIDSFLHVVASPENGFRYITMRWDNESSSSACYNTTYTFMRGGIKAGETHTLYLNAYYTDGFYLDNKQFEETVPLAYTFHFVD